MKSAAAYDLITIEIVDKLHRKTLVKLAYLINEAIHLRQNVLKMTNYYDCQIA